MSPGASPTEHGRAGARPVHPRRRRAARPEAPPDRGGCARRRDGHRPGRADPGDRRGDRIDRARLGGRGGRRRRSADDARRSRGGLGRGGGVARLDLRPPIDTGVDTVTAPNGATASAVDRCRRRGCTCASDVAIRSTRSCSAATAPAPRTWRSAGCAARASRSPTTGHRSTSRSARSGCCAPSTPHRSTSRSSPPMDAPVNGSDAVFAAVAAAAWRHAGFPPEWPAATMNRDPVPSAR